MTGSGPLRIVDLGRRVALCSTEDVPEGGCLKVDKDGLSLAVFKIEGDFYVVDNDCTHGPGSLSEGFLDGYEIECDFHQGCFDVRTGEPTVPPCVIPVRTYDVTVDDGQLTIEY
jgi:nitrite reductase/ring-hydroxylating ferredoxin subunit